MDQIFPFGFNFPTGFYLSLYVLTFVLHQAFMHYVLAGSLFLVWCTAKCDPQESVLAEYTPGYLIRDWLPFLLSAAITAGVAPLLFVQIVYQHAFYTANLLLWWRWMIVVPVLIVAFYLLYLIKSRLLWRQSHVARITVVLGTAVCFLFVGFCWTANHLIASRSVDWPTIYATGTLPFTATEVLLRMSIWIGGSFGTLSVIVGWQRLYHQRHRADLIEHDTRTLAWMSITGTAVAMAGGIIYLMWEPPTRPLLISTMIAPYSLITLLGTGLEFTGWISQLRQKQLKSVHLALCSLGTFLSLLGIAVIREGIRLHSIDISQMFPLHAEAASMGGFPVFIVASAVVSAMIAWCFWLVRTGFVDETPPH